MTTFERLKSLIDTVFEGDIDTKDVTEETVLKDMGLNSIGFLYMAVAIEEEFGVKFTNADFASIITVKDVIGIIEG